MIKLARAQLSYYNKVLGPLDITVKNAKGWVKHFAPTWDMVMDHKKGKMTDEEYTLKYHQKLANGALSKSVWRGLNAHVRDNDNHITFLCFCPDGKFCHTELLIDWLIDKYPHTFERK